MESTLSKLKNGAERAPRIRRGDARFFLEATDVAYQLGLTYRTVLDLIRRGELPAGKVAGKWRIYDRDLFDFFRRCCRRARRKAEKAGGDRPRIVDPEEDG